MGHINKVIQVPQGSDFVIRQDDKSNIILYTVQNGKLNKYQSSNELGMWENIALTEQEFKLIDSGILEVDGDYSEDIDVILMNKLDETRIVVMPDDKPPYSYSTPYRLYYAYDTKKLYMNMADSWHFIASLDHNLLENNGKLSHVELETILDRLTERITNVEQGTSIENVATKDDLEELRELLAGNVAALKDYVDNHTGTPEPPPVPKEYRSINPDRYDVKTDAVGEYVEIPSTIIPMDDVISTNVTIIPEPHVFNFTQENNAEDIYDGWYDGASMVPPTANKNKSWLVPIEYSRDTIIKVKVTGNDRFRLGYKFQINRPISGEAGFNKVASGDELTEYTFTVGNGGRMWLLLYCAANSDVIPPLELTYSIMHASYNAPNWVPSYDKMLTRIDKLEAGGGGGTPPVPPPNQDFLPPVMPPIINNKVKMYYVMYASTVTPGKWFLYYFDTHNACVINACFYWIYEPDKNAWVYKTEHSSVTFAGFEPTSEIYSNNRVFLGHRAQEGGLCRFTI